MSQLPVLFTLWIIEFIGCLSYGTHAACILHVNSTDYDRISECVRFRFRFSNSTTLTFSSAFSLSGSTGDKMEEKY